MVVLCITVPVMNVTNFAPSDDWVTNGRGQRLIPPLDDPDGKPLAYTRVTSFAAAAEDGSGLKHWVAWQAVRGALADPDSDTVTAVKAATQVPVTLIERLADAGGGGEARDTGSRRHKVVAYGLAGVDLSPMPGPARQQAERVIDAVRSLGELTHLEAPIVCDRWQCCGTADYILRAADGTTVVADLKTGSKGPRLLSTSAQLAAYAAGQHFDHKQQQRTGSVAADMDSVRLAVIWAPQTGEPPRVIWLDTAEAVRSAELAHTVRQARRDWGRRERAAIK